MRVAMFSPIARRGPPGHCGPWESVVSLLTEGLVATLNAASASETNGNLRLIMPDDYLLYFGRIHLDKGAKEAIEIAKACNKTLILAGVIQDEGYYQQCVQPYLDHSQVTDVGSVSAVQRNMLLGRASALLHPIHFDEALGLSVIEVMALVGRSSHSTRAVCQS